MSLDIGAKMPIRGEHVFLVGSCKYPGEKPFVVLFDPEKQRETKRNLQGVEPQKVVQALGGSSMFASIEIPAWGTAWVRRSSVEKVIEMSAAHLELSSESIGCRILFLHESEEKEDELPGRGFSLYGITTEQATKALQQ